MFDSIIKEAIKETLESDYFVEGFWDRFYFYVNGSSAENYVEEIANKRDEIIKKLLTFTDSMV